jgi:putative transposon-encoded protein
MEATAMKRGLRSSIVVPFEGVVEPFGLSGGTAMVERQNVGINVELVLRAI